MCLLHYENLELFLRLGLKLKKIHRVLEFNQSQWLKPYIEFNTQKRIGAEKIMTKMELINEQFYIWENNGKQKKQNRYKTSKQQKRLFRMYIKTMLYVARNNLTIV